MIALLDYGVVIKAILLVGGIYWCHEMFGRWRKDLEEYRTSDDQADRLVIALLWGVTVVILLLMINFVLGLLGVGVTMF